MSDGKPVSNSGLSAGFSCDFKPSAGVGGQAGAGEIQSRVVRGSGPGRWNGVTPTRYKREGGTWERVVRSVLVGDGGEKTGFHVRYFEVEPGGFSTLEEHAHEHVVIVLRGDGVCVLGDESHRLRPFDLVYVAPREVHQLRNPGDTPFGFLCVVDAERDRPVPVGEEGA